MYNTDQLILEKCYLEKVLKEDRYGSGGQRITKAQLVDIIKDIEASHKGTNFFGVTQVTRENTKVAPVPAFVLTGLKTNKGKTYFAKVSQVNGQVGYDYTAAVNRQREREGKETDFKAKASVYDAVPGSTALQRKGDQIYIRYRPLQVATGFSPVYVKAVSENPVRPNQFTVVPKADVSQYKASIPETGFYQGVDTGVEARVISLDSVAAMTIGGQSYTISDLDPIRQSIYQVASAPVPTQPTAP